MKEVLITKGVNYCYIDDFYSGGSYCTINEILLNNIRKEMSLTISPHTYFKLAITGEFFIALSTHIIVGTII